MSQSIRVLKFLRFLARPYQGYLWVMFGTIVFIVLQGSFEPFLIGKLVDAAVHPVSTGVGAVALLYGLFRFIPNVGWALNNYCAISTFPCQRTESAEFFIRHLYDRSFLFFQDQQAGSLTSKVGDVFNLAHLLIFMIINQLGYGLLQIAFSLALLVHLAPVFAVAMVLWLLALGVISGLSFRTMCALTREYAEAKARLFGLVADYLSNMWSVKTFARKDFELDRFHESKKGFIAIGRKQGFYSLRFYVWINVAVFTYSITVIFFLVSGYQRSVISPGDIAFVLMTNLSLFSMIFQFMQDLREFVNSWGSVDQALSFLDDLPEIQDKPGAPALQIQRGSIGFDQVQFHYKNLDPLFQNKSVTIEAGQKVGLVGYSGGGKSTFVNLILRLYDVTAGRILIDGQDIREVTQDSLRGNIAVIPQDPALFHRTLMENIRYGRVSASEEEVREAARHAHADEFITALPQGYDTLVGERGVKLSGGQRQRIAIARAILKNAPILILDEATSQLDSLTESEIQKSLWELMQGKTTLVIAHRLSTLQHMDRILVFDQGKIIEDGTHAELLSQGGVYKALWETQSQLFRE